MKKNAFILMFVLALLAKSNHIFAQAVESTTVNVCSCTTHSMKMKIIVVYYNYIDSAKTNRRKALVLSPVFDSSTTNYTVSLPSSKNISSLDVSANSVSANFPFMINGKRPTTGTTAGSYQVLNLSGIAVNSRQIIIENRSPDLKNKMTYTIEVVQD